MLAMNLAAPQPPTDAPGPLASTASTDMPAAARKMLSRSAVVRGCTLTPLLSHSCTFETSVALSAGAWEDMFVLQWHVLEAARQS